MSKFDILTYFTTSVIIELYAQITADVKIKCELIFNDLAFVVVVVVVVVVQYCVVLRNSLLVKIEDFHTQTSHNS